MSPAVRLLRLEPEGELSIVEFTGSYIPRYAILAHLWGTEDRDIRYRDVVERRYKEKPAYHDVMLCGKKAASHGLRYIWVASCCVEKTYRLRFEVARDDMFRMYSKASRCYVILSDVTIGDFPEPRNPYTPQESHVKSSAWFKQMWDLAPLVVPKSVEFLSHYGHLLGSRSSLKQTISEATGLPIEALYGSPLIHFNRMERLSWAASLGARRQEENLYSDEGLIMAEKPLHCTESDGTASIKRLALEVENFPSAQGTIDQIYRPLGEGRLRIFLLDAGEPGSAITGHLDDFRMDRYPGFNAVSYVWGQEPPIHRIRINNYEVLIRPNLFHALQRMRHAKKNVPLWVDSLCIDQSNTTERTAQVRMMADIYKTARTVWIWLGEHDLTSGSAMKSIVSVAKEDTHQPDINFPAWNRVYGSIEKLMRRDWFRRGWTIQEAAFSKDAVVFCGDQQIPLKALKSAVDRGRHSLEEFLLRSPAMNVRVSNVLTNFQSLPATRFLDLLENIFDRPGYLPYPGPLALSIEALVELTVHCETTDPRDAVFALLGLANDLSAQQDPDEYMIPEYCRDTLTVFANLVVHCSRHSGSLDIICRPWAPVLTQNEPKLPSWIAVRDRLPFGNPLNEFTQRLNGKSLVGSCLKPVYNAHCGVRSQICEEIVAQDGFLRVKGIVLGEIEELSMRMADAIVTKNSLLLFKEHFETEQGTLFFDSVWRILCADRDGSGDPAPLSWNNQFWNVWTMITQGKLQDFENGTDTIDIEELLECGLGEGCDRFLRTVRDVVWNRRTFRGSTTTAPIAKLIGLAPRRARTHDYVCIVYGCSVPVVMRKFENEDGSCHWVLIGEAYVHGFMLGEGISRLSPEALVELEEMFEIR